MCGGRTSTLSNVILLFLWRSDLYIICTQRVDIFNFRYLKKPRYFASAFLLILFCFWFSYSLLYFHMRYIHSKNHYAVFDYHSCSTSEPCRLCPASFVLLELFLSQLVLDLLLLLRLEPVA